MESCLPTPQAIRHLNLEVFVTPSGRCLSAKTKNKTTLDELIALNYIESYHAEYGLTFSILRDVWLGHLNASSDRLSDSIKSLCSNFSPNEVYDHVYHRLQPRRAEIILWAVHTYQKPQTGSSALMLEIFDRLAYAFTEAHKVLADKKAI